MNEYVLKRKKERKRRYDERARWQITYIIIIHTELYLEDMG